MFLKVFKYDFKSVFFKFLPIFAVLPILAIVVRLFGLINTDNIIINIVNNVLNFLFSIAISITFFYVFIILLMRYVNSLFKDQAYLTHTLPVSKNKLLLSKYLLAFVIEAITILFVILCLMIAYNQGDIFNQLKAVIGSIHVGLENVYSSSEITASLVMLCIIVVISPILSYSILFLGIALGHSFSKNKNILSVIFCLVINYGLGFLSLIAIIVPIVSTDLQISIAGICGGILGGCVVIIVISYLLNFYLVRNRLNLE